MRKETSNTWSDGLIMDLNPLNTPNTVLTDNLNGTLITYNGNEHSLQNDMGNYKLKNCRLTPNYVPVGLKQYGDILYIVSYNPLDETTEIGSYPSPLQVNSSEPLSNLKTIDYSILKTIEQVGSEFNTEQVEQNQFHFIFAEEHLKLNPGDLYKLYVDQETAPKYEALEYFIVDESKKLHEVTDLIEKNLLKPGFQNIPWTVPGWLSVKSRIVQFDRFSMDILNFKVFDESGQGRFRFQFAINDSHLIRLYKTNKYQFLKDLRITFEIFKKDEDLHLLKAWDLNVYDENYIIKEWYDDNIIVQFDFDFGNLALNNNDFIKFKATPYLVESDKFNYKLIYEKLIQEIETWVDNIVVLNASNVAVGLDTYRFRVSNDESSVGIEFDLSNPNLDDSQASYLDPELNLWYMIYDLNGNKVLDRFKKIVTSGLGIYNLNIDFTDKFSIENIYIIQFVLSKTDPAPNSDMHWSKDQPDTIGSKVLITSKVFNDFYNESYQKFDESIDFETWVNKYIEQTYENAEIKINSVPTITKVKEISKRTSNNTNYWDESVPFNTFVLTGNVVENEKVLLGHECEVSVKIENGFKETLTKNKIGMWNNLFSKETAIELGVLDETGKTIKVPVTSSKNTDMTEASINNDKLVYHTHIFLQGDCVASESDPIQFQPFSTKTIKDKWGIGGYKDSGKIIRDLWFQFIKGSNKTSHAVEISWADSANISNPVVLKEEAFKDKNRDIDTEPATWFKFDDKEVPFYYASVGVYHKGNVNDWLGLQALWQTGGSEEKDLTFASYEGSFGRTWKEVVAFRMDNGNGKNENVVFLPSTKDHSKYLDYIVADPLGEAGIYSQWKFEDVDWSLRNNAGVEISAKLGLESTWKYLNYNLMSLTDLGVINSKFPGVNMTLLKSETNLQINPTTPSIVDFNYTYTYEESEFPYLDSETTKGKSYWESVYRNKLRDVHLHMQEWNNSVVSSEFTSRNNNVKGIYHPEGIVHYSDSDFIKQTTLFYRKYDVPGFSYVESDPQTHFDTALYKLSVFVTDSGDRMQEKIGYYLDEIS